MRIVRRIKDSVSKKRGVATPPNRPGLDRFTTDELRGYLASLKPGTAKTTWSPEQAKVVTAFLAEVDRAYGEA